MCSVWIATVIAVASISATCSDRTLCCDGDSLGQVTGKNVADLQASGRRLNNEVTASRHNSHHAKRIHSSKAGGFENNHDTKASVLSGHRAPRKNKKKKKKGDHHHHHVHVVPPSEKALDGTKLDDGDAHIEGAGEGDATLNMVPYPFDERPRRVVAPPGGVLENARAVYTEISADILVSHHEYSYTACCWSQKLNGNMGNTTSRLMMY